MHDLRHHGSSLPWEKEENKTVGELRVGLDITMVLE
jgi:hypothetical protein